MGVDVIAVKKSSKKSEVQEPKDEVEVWTPPSVLPEEVSSEEGGESAFVLQYDTNSNQRYVDSTSQKSEFDKVLDELASISRETLEWDVEKFTRKYAGDEEEILARKLEAFLGAFITNAALGLYNRGYPEVAFRRLEQARNVLEARQKLELEVEAIKAKQDESFDISDMLGLFDGEEQEDGEPAE